MTTAETEAGTETFPAVPDETVDERYLRARMRYLAAVDEFCASAEEVASVRGEYEREWSARRKAGMVDDFPEFVPPGTFPYRDVDRKLRAQAVARW